MSSFTIKILSCVLLSLLIAINTSCAKTEQNDITNVSPSWQQVTVVYLNFEGGFFGMITQEGKKLLPMNLPQKYQIVDTKLKIKGNEVEGLLTTQQWGIPFKIIDIELIKLGKKLSSNEY